MAGVPRGLQVSHWVVAHFPWEQSSVVFLALMYLVEIAKQSQCEDFWSPKEVCLFEVVMNHKCLEHEGDSSPFPKSLLWAYPIKPVDTVHEQIGGQQSSFSRYASVY